MSNAAVENVQKGAKTVLKAQKEVKPEPKAGVSEAYTAATKVGSLEELKAVAPPIYKAVCQGIAQSVIADIQSKQRRLREAHRRHRGG